MTLITVRPRPGSSDTTAPVDHDAPDSAHLERGSITAARHGARSATFYQWMSACLLLGGTAFQFWYVASGQVNLAPDEAQYWDWSRRLDWSYYSKGPLVPALIALSTGLGGNTELYVRLPAIMLALATAVVLYGLARRLFHSERTAFLTLLIASACPLYAAGTMLMTTDPPWVFCWILALYSLHRATDPTPPRSLRWALLFGAAFGLGLLAKYTMLLLLPCLGVYVALSPAARAWMRAATPYWALALAAVVAAPLVVWNSQHGWGSLHHVLWQAGLTGAATSPSTKNFFNFLGSQLGVISPLLFVALACIIIRAGHIGWRHHDDRYSLLFAFSVPPLLFFLLWSTAEKVQGNWAAVAYCTAFVATARWWDEWLTSADSRRQLRWRMTAIAAVVVPGFAISLAAFFPPLLPAVGIHIPPRLHPAIRLLHGWKDVGAAVARQVDADRQAGGDPFVMSDRYQITSELAFYLPDHPRTYNIDFGRRLNQYDVWGGLEAQRGRDGLFVTSGTRDAPAALRAVCAQAEPLEIIETRVSGALVETFAIFRCRHFRGPTHAAAGKAG